MSTTKITVSIDEKILRKLDDKTKGIAIDRSKIIEVLIEIYLLYLENPDKDMLNDYLQRINGLENEK